MLIKTRIIVILDLRERMLMREKILLSTLVLGDSQEAVLALDLVTVKAALDDFQDDNLVCEGE